MSGYDCLNKKRFNSRRKVDSELAATTSVGSVLQMCGAAIAKARLTTVDSLTGGTTRRLDSWVERNVPRPGKSSTRVSGPRQQRCGISLPVLHQLVSINKSVSTGCQRTLPVFTAERRHLQLSTDLLPTGNSAANPLAASAAVDRWDRRTDGRSNAT